MVAEKAIHILAIDDDPALHCLVDRALIRLGYQVTTATDGASGMEALADGNFGLLLLDYDMPGMSGLDVVRATGMLPDPPPIIMLTGRGNERVAVEALKLGAADYLVKDIDLAFLELLPTVIERVLTRRRLEAERDQLFIGIQESEQRYRHLVDLIPDGIAIVVDGRIALVNPAGCRILGAENVAAVVGTEFSVWFGQGDFGDEVREMCRRALSDPKLPHWQEYACCGPGKEQMILEMLALRFSYLGADGVEVIFRDITEKRLYRERLEHLATFDALTDLPNRVLFFEKFQQIMALSTRYQDLGAVLFLDLDGFKTINDTYGHEAGDQVLQEVAARLRDCVRQVDVVARLAGDEFLVVLAKLAHLDDAGAVATKIIAEICRPLQAGGVVLQTSVSIGISVFPQDGTDPKELLRLADHAMYRAKRLGGGQFSFAAQADGRAQ